MTQLPCDAEVGAQECGGQLGDQFLGRVCLFVEATFEVAIEA